MALHVYVNMKNDDIYFFDKYYCFCYCFHRISVKGQFYGVKEWYVVNQKCPYKCHLAFGISKVLQTLGCLLASELCGN